MTSRITRRQFTAGAAAGVATAAFVILGRAIVRGGPRGRDRPSPAPKEQPPPESLRQKDRACLTVWKVFLQQQGPPKV